MQALLKLILLLFILFSIPGNASAYSPQVSSNKENQVKDKQVTSKKEKTTGQKMVEFIRNILGDKPKPIDEKLVRDEV